MTKELTTWGFGGTAFTGAVQMNSATVRLNSGTVNMQGNATGTGHFNDNKNPTTWTNVDPSS